VRSIYERAVAEIRATLRPEQAAKFDKMVVDEAKRLHLNEATAPDTTPRATVSPKPATPTGTP
jgi:hypothetical protein